MSIRHLFNVCWQTFSGQLPKVRWQCFKSIASRLLCVQSWTWINTAFLSCSGQNVHWTHVHCPHFLVLGIAWQYESHFVSFRVLTKISNFRHQESPLWCGRKFSKIFFAPDMPPTMFQRAVVPSRHLLRRLRATTIAHSAIRGAAAEGAQPNLFALLPRWLPFKI